jgi:hypothetical protein
MQSKNAANPAKKVSWFRRLFSPACQQNPNNSANLDTSGVTNSKKGGKNLMNSPLGINNPADDPALLLRKWQVDICTGNRCAATVLAYFIASYESEETTKPDQTTEYRHYTHEVIEKGTLNLYGKAAIIRALKVLEQKKIIIKHPDKANQYALCIETLNTLLEQRPRQDSNPSPDGNTAGEEIWPS